VEKTRAREGKRRIKRRKRKGREEEIQSKTRDLHLKKMVKIIISIFMNHLSLSLSVFCSISSH